MKREDVQNNIKNKYYIPYQTRKKDDDSYSDEMKRYDPGNKKIIDK